MALDYGAIICMIVFPIRIDAGWVNNSSHSSHPIFLLPGISSRSSASAESPVITQPCSSLVLFASDKFIVWAVNFNPCVRLSIGIIPCPKGLDCMLAERCLPLRRLYLSGRLAGSKCRIAIPGSLARSHHSSCYYRLCWTKSYWHERCITGKLNQLIEIFIPFWWIDLHSLHYEWVYFASLNKFGAKICKPVYANINLVVVCITFLVFSEISESEIEFSLSSRFYLKTFSAHYTVNNMQISQKFEKVHGLAPKRGFRFGRTSNTGNSLFLRSCSVSVMSSPTANIAIPEWFVKSTSLDPDAVRSLIASLLCKLECVDYHLISVAVN